MNQARTDDFNFHNRSEKSSGTALCPLTKDNITEQDSKGVTVDMIIQKIDIPGDQSDSSEPETCVIR